MRREINESFIDHKDFDNWALALSESRKDNVFKIKLDDKQADYFSIIIYPDFDNLVLLAPLEVFNYGPHEYETTYPQIGPLAWKELIILEELDELEAVKEVTKDEKAELYEYPEEDEGELI